MPDTFLNWGFVVLLAVVSIIVCGAFIFAVVYFIKKLGKIIRS